MKRFVVLVVVAVLTGCASRGTPPPAISLDEPVAATFSGEPPKPVQTVEVPVPLALPCQLKPVTASAAAAPEPADPVDRVTHANDAARVAPSSEGYINAIQVWPYTEGALYQVYTSPGHVTVIALQEGEELTANGVSAGDTVRWIVGDTTSGSGTSRRASILIKPTRTNLSTNLVITTNRRTYLLELTSTEQAWMASASWDYPKDRLFALQQQAQQAEAAEPVATGLRLEDLMFRYAIRGDAAPWKPTRVFDDGERVYIQFPDRIAQGELPPLFVIGQEGDAQLVNYRFRAPYYIVDRLFGAAELRLGGEKAQVVRIERIDGPSGRAGS